MTKYIKKNINSYITIFLLLSPILDLLTGISRHLLKIDLSIGIIIRMLFLISIVLISYFVYKKKKLLIPYLVILIYSILYFIGMINHDNMLFLNIQNAAKILYFPVLLLSLYTIKDNIKIDNKTLYYVLVIYIICIFIPLLLNLGYKSYKITKVGTLGFYNSANEISGIISILTPILFLNIYKEKRKRDILFTIIYLLVIVTIGTKTPILTLGITLGATFVYLIKKFKEEKKYKSIINSFILLFISIVGIIILIPNTNFYKNIDTHMKFLHIDEIEDVANPKVFDHFIFSERLKFLSNRTKEYHKSNLYEKIFGTGFTKNNQELKQVEIDYFDIYLSLGIIGFIISIGIFVYILFKVLNKKKIKDYQDYMYSLSIFIIILLSFFTGHIITAPSVSLIVSLIIISTFNTKYKKRIKK